MKDELHILWTNADIITSEKMMFMYARNALLNRWWKKVTVIIWGATEKLAAENKIIQGRIEVKPWGKLLTDLIKEGKPLLTV